jgi:class 3 adenylate cyclase
MLDTGRFAVILVADVVGYSRLMVEHEAGIAQALREHRAAADPLVTRYGGRIVTNMGDGVLIEFASVTGAVECALAWQRLAAERNAGNAEDHRVDWRIGIHVGGVVVEGDFILGNGVDVAARLEALAEPGGICISEGAFRQVSDEVAAQFVDLGERRLRNIARPLRVYRADLAAAPEPPTTAKPRGLSVSALLNARIGATVRTTLSGPVFALEADLARSLGRGSPVSGVEEERWWGEATREGPAPVLSLWESLPRRKWLIALCAATVILGGYFGGEFLREVFAALASAIAEFFHAKTSALPDGHEVTIALAVGVASPTTRSAEQQPSLDLVDVSAFAPAGGSAGSEVLVQVFLHRLDDAAIVQMKAGAADPDTIRRGTATLVAEIARGKRVDILLEGRDIEIDDPLQSLVWRGEPCAAGFLVTLPETTADRSCNLRVRILLDDVPIGSLRFALKVSAHTPIDPRGVTIRGDTAARYHRAFLSYATPDRPEVLKRAQALQAAHIEFFQDILSIEPGERWEQELYKEIDLCDLFLLFWSANAARSEWVLREAELAVARQSASPDEEPDITPIILEGPPVPQPIPDFLKHLQFNDYLVYLIAATERERRATDLSQ